MSELDKRFSRFLSRRRGQVIVAEQFHVGTDMEEPEGGWQRAMSSLVTRAVRDGRLKARGVGRDKFRSFKRRWLVVV